MAQTIAVNVHGTKDQGSYTASVDSGPSGTGYGNGGTITISLDGVEDGTPWLKVEDDGSPPLTKGEQISVSDASTSFDIYMY
jgi:hypothetical protein